MARYKTNEQEYHCEECDIWVTERQMIPTIKRPMVENDTPGGFCPGCEHTQWANIIAFSPVVKTIVRIR